jgi:hypothetical protein
VVRAGEKQIVAFAWLPTSVYRIERDATGHPWRKHDGIVWFKPVRWVRNVYAETFAVRA